MRTLLVTALLASMLPACSASNGTEETASATEALHVPSPLAASEFGQPLTKASIRALQTWIDDTTFERKWSSMLSSPIAFFGGADSAFHADLATLPTGRLPGHETLCQGDAKLDNFGWTRVDGKGLFADNDFDDAGFCPVAADVLRYLVATDLWFGDASLDAAALTAYVATIQSPASAIPIDPQMEPDWDQLAAKELSKATSGDAFVLGGEVQPATPAEVAAVVALAASDARFPARILDVVRNVRTDGGSAGLRRFWLLGESDGGTRPLLELKELTLPGTEIGWHSQALDGPSRFDVLKPFFWGSDDPGDHYTVYVVGGRFLVRDRLLRANVKPEKMTRAQITNVVEAEASLLALEHRRAWKHVNASKLRTWLQASAAMLTTRWRDAYAAAGGK